MSKLKIFLSILIILFISPTIVNSLDTSFFSVKLKNYSEKVYSDSVSKYQISSLSEFRLPNTPFQRVIGSGWSNNNYYILISSGRVGISTSTSLKKHLKDTRLLMLDNPKIKKLRDKFHGSNNIIDDVENFVSNHIKHKKLGIPIISAVNILESRTGDCTEHTILTVAILRSLGIPTRALVGMVLCKEFGDSRNVFVYHMWAEAYKDGEWVLIDATCPGEKYNNRYIAFSYHHLKTEMPLSFLKAISAMRNFTIDYLIEPKNESRLPDAHRVEGSTGFAQS